MIQKSMLSSKIFLQELLLSDSITNSILENIDELIEIIPELKDMIGFKHKHPHHHLDVWNHTLLSLSLSEKDFEIRLVLLLHDIGKPHCYQDEGIRHFEGYPKVSKEISLNILRRLNYTTKFIEEVCCLIEKHDDLITEKDIENNYDLAYKRYLVQVSDLLAHHPDKLEKRVDYLKRINKMLVENKNIKKKIYK